MNPSNLVALYTPWVLPGMLLSTMPLLYGLLAEVGCREQEMFPGPTLKPTSTASGANNLNRGPTFQQVECLNRRLSNPSNFFKLKVQFISYRTSASHSWRLFMYAPFKPYNRKLNWRRKAQLITTVSQHTSWDTSTIDSRLIFQWIHTGGKLPSFVPLWSLTCREAFTGNWTLFDISQRCTGQPVSFKAFQFPLRPYLDSFYHSWLSCNCRRQRRKPS